MRWAEEGRPFLTVSYIRFPEWGSQRRKLKASPLPSAELARRNRNVLSSPCFLQTVACVHLSGTIEKKQARGLPCAQGQTETALRAPRGFGPELEAVHSPKKFHLRRSSNTSILGRAWILLWLLRSSCGMEKLPIACLCLRADRKLCIMLFPEYLVQCQAVMVLNNVCWAHEWMNCIWNMRHGANSLALQVISTP